MLLNTLIAPINIGIFSPILFIPVQHYCIIVTSAAKANIALFTTATYHTLTDITSGMNWEFFFTFDTFHLSL